MSFPTRTNAEIEVATDLIIPPVVGNKIINMYIDVDGYLIIVSKE